MQTRAFAVLLAAAVVAAASHSASAAVIEAANDDLSDADLRDYAALLEDSMVRLGPAKRAHFCLTRDMSCPNLETGKDFCCRGSQCACNLFGQNCKCSSMGLFQRLG